MMKNDGAPKKRYRRTIAELMPVWLEAANKGDAVARAKYEKAAARRNGKTAKPIAAKPVTAPKQPKNTLKDRKEPKQRLNDASMSKELSNVKSVKPDKGDVTTNNTRNTRKSEVKKRGVGKENKRELVDTETENTHFNEAPHESDAAIAAVGRYCLAVCCQGRAKLYAVDTKMLVGPDCTNSDCPLYPYRRGVTGKTKKVG